MAIIFFHGNNNSSRVLLNTVFPEIFQKKEVFEAVCFFSSFFFARMLMPPSLFLKMTLPFAGNRRNGLGEQTSELQERERKFPIWENCTAVASRLFQSKHRE